LPQHTLEPPSLSVPAAHNGPWN